MSLKKVVAIVFVALVLFFLFGTLAMADDDPTRGPTKWHPWEEVNRFAPGHAQFGIPPVFNHPWEEVKRAPAMGHPEQEMFRPDPTKQNPDVPWEDHPWEEVKRIDSEHPWQE